MKSWSTKLLVRRALAVAASALAVSSALAGQITLFENPAFGGRRIVLTASVANFDRGSFNDRASSMIIAADSGKFAPTPAFRDDARASAPVDTSRSRD